MYDLNIELTPRNYSDASFLRYIPGGESCPHVDEEPCLDSNAHEKFHCAPNLSTLHTHSF